MKIAVLLAVLALAGCAEYRPSEAKCFSLMETESPCDFELVGVQHPVVASD